MFSFGNITEKLRVAGFDCRGETVVDLYAGVDTFHIVVYISTLTNGLYCCFLYSKNNKKNINEINYVENIFSIE